MPQKFAVFAFKTRLIVAQLYSQRLLRPWSNLWRNVGRGHTESGDSRRVFPPFPLPTLHAWGEQWRRDTVGNVYFTPSDGAGCGTRRLNPWTWSDNQEQNQSVPLLPCFYFELNDKSILQCSQCHGLGCFCYLLGLSLHWCEVETVP